MTAHVVRGNHAAHHELPEPGAHAHHEGAHALPGSPHHHHGMGTSITASLGILAARYTQRLYEGDYQATVAGVRGTYRHVGAGISVPVYRLTRNGITDTGVGDAMLHVHARLVSHGPVMAGVMAMVMFPTGSSHDGLGMGHLMGSPQLWGMWGEGRVAIHAAAGVGYAMGGSGAHAEHGGVWPVVRGLVEAAIRFD